MRTITDFTVVDQTLQLYQDRRTWLNAVCRKYDKKTAACCAKLVPLEVDTMNLLEEMTGVTIDQVLEKARRFAS